MPMNEKIILFPGSFDPFTVGHKSLVDRVLPVFDKVIVAIGRNEAKPGADPVERRMESVRLAFSGEPKVEVVAYDGLTVDACLRHGARWMLRGVRTVADYEYERNLADINRELAGIDTFILFTLPGLASVSSSVVRELARYGKDISRYIP